MITIKVFALWLSFVLTMAGGPLTDPGNIDGRNFTSYESKIFKELDAISEVNASTIFIFTNKTALRGGPVSTKV